jgi:hypothetical protein
LSEKCPQRTLSPLTHEFQMQRVEQHVLVLGDAALKS